MLVFLIIGIGFAIAGILSLAKARWRSAAIRFAISFASLAVLVYVLLSWNAVMLQVQHDATTRAAR